VNKGKPLATVNLTPASEIDLVFSSVASFLVRELLQLPACLCSIVAASLVLSTLYLPCARSLASNLATKFLAFPISYLETGEQGHTPLCGALCQYLAGEEDPLRLRFTAREAEMCPTSD